DSSLYHASFLLKFFARFISKVSADVSFAIGYGSRVRFWEDVWCSDLPLSQVFPNLALLVPSKDIQVVDYFSSNSSLA
ncbi:hypothetical protein PJI17_31870, partial [Mycobacterium kansasii]